MTELSRPIIIIVIAIMTQLSLSQTSNADLQSQTKHTENPCSTKRNIKSSIPNHNCLAFSSKLSTIHRRRRRRSTLFGPPSNTKLAYEHHHHRHRDAYRDDNDSVASSKRSSQAEAEAQAEALAVKKFSTLRSLGIDYGLSRTGLAVTTGGYRPRPLTILSGYTKQYILRKNHTTKEEYYCAENNDDDDDGENTTTSGNEEESVIRYNNTRLCRAIVTFATAERVTNLVLGLPLHKNGSISEQSTLTHEFGMELLQWVRRECGTTMNVTLWDERYTSKEAASRIVGEAMAKNRDLNSLDLEGCLDDEAACIILEHYYQVLGKDAEVLNLETGVEEECKKVFELKLAWEEKRRQQVLEDRARMWNARRDMIERDRVFEEENGGAEGSIGKKKKKRKKKK